MNMVYVYGHLCTFPEQLPEIARLLPFLVIIIHVNVHLCTFIPNMQTGYSFFKSSVCFVHYQFDDVHQFFDPNTTP